MGAAITVGTLVMLVVSLSVEGIAQRVVLGVTVTTIVAAYCRGWPAPSTDLYVAWVQASWSVSPWRSP